MTLSTVDNITHSVYRGSLAEPGHLYTKQCLVARPGITHSPQSCPYSTALLQDILVADGPTASEPSHAPPSSDKHFLTHPLTHSSGVARTDVLPGHHKCLAKRAAKNLLINIHETCILCVLSTTFYFLRA